VARPLFLRLGAYQLEIISFWSKINMQTCFNELSSYNVYLLLRLKPETHWKWHKRRLEMDRFLVNTKKPIANFILHKVGGTLHNVKTNFVHLLSSNRVLGHRFVP